MGKLKSLKELFAGRHFDREVIILCVRWYLRYKLSLRDLVEMMAERTHPTQDRRVRKLQAIAPLLATSGPTG